MNKEFVEELREMGQVVLPVTVKVLGITTKVAAMLVLVTIVVIIQIIEYLTPKVITAYKWGKPRVIRGLKELVHRIFYYSQNPPKFPEFVPFGIMGL